MVSSCAYRIHSSVWMRSQRWTAESLNARITGILLAAGSSRRFGSNKLLAPLSDGTPLVLAAARRLRSVLDAVIVVVHPQDRVLPELLATEHVQIVACQHADTGMGASLAAGVAASANARGWLIVLADMPAIQVSTLQRVAQALDNGAVLARLFMPACVVIRLVFFPAFVTSCLRFPEKPVRAIFWRAMRRHSRVSMWTMLGSFWMWTRQPIWRRGWPNRQLAGLPVKTHAGQHTGRGRIVLIAVDIEINVLASSMKLKLSKRSSMPSAACKTTANRLL